MGFLAAAGLFAFTVILLGICHHLLLRIILLIAAIIIGGKLFSIFYSCLLLGACLHLFFGAVSNSVDAPLFRTQYGAMISLFGFIFIAIGLIGGAMRLL